MRPALALLLAAPLALAACGTATVTPPTVPTTYSGLADAVFVPSCTTVNGCHKTADAKQGLDLTKANGFASLVGTAVVDPKWAGTPWATFKRVEPGHPETSALVISLEQPAGLPTGLGMPSGSKLSQDKIDAIKAWITAGAKND